MDLIIDAPDCLNRDDLTNIIVVSPALGMLIKLPRFFLSNDAGSIYVENVKYRLEGNSGYRPRTIIHRTATHYKCCRGRTGCGKLYGGYVDRGCTIVYVLWYRRAYRASRIGVWAAPCSLCTDRCCLLLVVDNTISCRQHHELWRIQWEKVGIPGVPWDLLDRPLGLRIIICVTGERMCVRRAFR